MRRLNPYKYVSRLVLIASGSPGEIGGGFGVLSPGSIYEQRLTQLMARVSMAVERNENRLEEQDRREAIALEWKQLALVCDRFIPLHLLISALLLNDCNIENVFQLIFFYFSFSIFLVSSLFCFQQNSLAHLCHHHNGRHLRRAHIFALRSLAVSRHTHRSCECTLVIIVNETVSRNRFRCLQIVERLLWVLIVIPYDDVFECLWGVVYWSQLMRWVHDDIYTFVWYARECIITLWTDSSFQKWRVASRKTMTTV